MAQSKDTVTTHSTDAFALQSKGLEVLETGTLKTGDHFKVVKLTGAHDDLAYRFHKYVLAQLSESARIFMKQKTRAYFREHLDQRSGSVIGIIAHNRLIGLGVAHHPQGANKNKSLTGLCKIFDTAANKVCVLQSGSIDPAFRGNNLQQLLIKHRIEQGEKAGRTLVVSKIKTQNVASWYNIMKSGLKLINIEYDEAVGMHHYNAAAPSADALKTLSSGFSVATQGHDGHAVEVALPMLEQQKSYMAQGYQGTGINKDNKALILTPS